jgi:hypothetical protein
VSHDDRRRSAIDRDHRARSIHLARWRVGRVDMKKHNTTHPSKRLVLKREVLANLVTGGRSTPYPTFQKGCNFHTFGNCLTATCGIGGSCADCAGE